MFHRFKVPELKKYLKDRGIQTTSRRKESLIRLAEAANDLNFPIIPEDDYVISAVSRRTVLDKSTNDPVILPDIASVTSWNDDLRKLPKIEMGDIMVYLLNKCFWSSDRLKSYKNDSSFLLFTCRHISDVKLFELNIKPYFYVKGKCIPETRQSEKPYDSWLIVDDTGSVYSGGCTCVADDGSCKHCIALMFAIQNFGDRHQDRGTQVGTDDACKWDKPRKQSEPSKINFLHYGSQTSSKELYKPNTEERDSISQSNLEKAIRDICKGTDSLILQTLEPSSGSDSDEETEPETFTEMLGKIQNESSGSNAEFSHILSVLCEKHTPQYICDVEQLTRGQRDNDLWFKHRKGRITASIAHSVLACKMEKLKPNNYIVKNVKGTSIPFSTQATEYGQSMEKVAMSMYVSQVRKLHKKFVNSDCGLFVSRQFPYMAGSPDAKVHCLCCGYGLVEIKCSFTHRHRTPIEIANDNDYYVYNDSGLVKLKKGTSWFTQIQTQLGVSEINYCDFVFFTLKDIAVDRIYFDETEFKKIQEKSCLFFKKFLM